MAVQPLLLRQKEIDIVIKTVKYTNLISGETFNIDVECSDTETYPNGLPIPTEEKWKRTFELGGTLAHEILD